MARFAVGKNSYAISDRSGLRYRYKDMRREWNGLLVGKDEYEPKHPQLEPYSRVSDAIGLKDARPDRVEPLTVFVGPPLVENSNLVPIKCSGQIGTVSIESNTTGAPVFGVSASASLGSVTVSTSGVVITQTFTVTVQSYLGANKYYIDGVRQDTVSLAEGNTYRFDQSDSSNSGHPLRLSTTSNGTHSGGTQYTTGVTTVGTPGSFGAYTEITVASGAPTLYYYCTNHSGMGGQANTP